MRIVSIPPYNWPQDDLQVPNGFGVMPNVEAQNRKLVQREAFVYSGQATVAVGGNIRLIIPTEADGDFWCDGLTIAIGIAPTDRPNLVVNGTVEISDIKTSLALTFPNAGISSFLMRNPFSSNGNFNNTTDNAHLQCRFPEPFCFTRSGGILIIIRNLDSSIIQANLAFTGWKEYKNASH
jgi:hypothetical protein